VKEDKNGIGAENPNLLDDPGETHSGMYLSLLADEPGEAEAAMYLNSLVDDPEDLINEAFQVNGKVDGKNYDRENKG
jgi:hypothetical protein